MITTEIIQAAVETSLVPAPVIVTTFAVIGPQGPEGPPGPNALEIETDTDFVLIYEDSKQ